MLRLWETKKTSGWNPFHVTKHFWKIKNLHQNSRQATMSPMPPHVPIRWNYSRNHNDRMLRFWWPIIDITTCNRTIKLPRVSPTTIFIAWSTHAFTKQHDPKWDFLDHFILHHHPSIWSFHLILAPTPLTAPWTRSITNISPSLTSLTSPSLSQSPPRSIKQSQRTRSLNPDLPSIHPLQHARIISLNTPYTDNTLLTDEEVMRFRFKARSRGNFALLLVKALFPENELRLWKCSGTVRKGNGFREQL